MFKTSANTATEKTQSLSSDAGKTKPANLVSDSDRRIGWKEFYKLMWDYKVRVWDQQHR